jgi:hypothetical protein
MDKHSIADKRRQWLIFAVVVSVLFSLWLMTQWISDARRSVSAIELLSLIPLPLSIFYARSNWQRSEIIVDIVLLCILWYLTYSFLHELSHLTSSVLVGRKITGYQLFPRFWEGQFFSGGGVASVPTGPLSDRLGFLTALAPYIKDVAFLVIGYLILQSQKVRNSFLVGFIFALCCLSPLFDIANNYSVYVLNPDTIGNDFQGAALSIGPIWTNCIGALFTISAAAVTLRMILVYKGFPKTHVS